MKAIILARVSSKDQEENYSIPAQTHKLLEYAKNKQLDVIKTISLVESSTKTNRKKFNELIHQIKVSREPIALVVDTVDRLQRSFRETPILDDLRKSGKLTLHFYRENLILDKDSNSSNLLRWDIAVMFAKSYVAQLSDNVRRSQKEKIKSGEWLAKAPFGYENYIREDGKHWIRPSKHASLVREMFRKYASGAYSIKNLHDWLLNTYAINKSTGQIGYILRNPFYKGIMVIKGSQYTHNYAHIIDDDLFQTAQQVADNYHKVPFKYAGKPYIYRGLIVCAECGCRITAEKSKGHVYYHCTQSRGRHNAHWFREEQITAQIQDIIGNISPSDAEYVSIMNILKSDLENQEKQEKEIRKEISLRLASIKTKENKLLDLCISGYIEKDIYKQKIDELSKEKQTLQAHNQDLEKVNDNWFSNISEIISLVKEAPLLFQKSSEIEEKRQILKMLFQNLEISGKRICYKLKKPFNSMAFSTNNTCGWGYRT